ncbi:MAG TPA: inorganic diphosphatase [Gemmatimonadales bacterium]
MTSPRPFHPWHDVPTGPQPPGTLTAIIEIPRHSRNKYELDKELGLFRLDRLLHSAVQFPGDYGFLPRTLGDDGDPLDVLVIMTMPVFTGCLVEVRPVGIFHLVDRQANDEKIIAVPTNDPFASEIQDIGDLRAHSLREIEHFFEVYKDLEGARVRSRGFEGRHGAEKAILAAMGNYEREFGRTDRRADGRTGRKPDAKPTRRPAKAVSRKTGPR